MESEQEVAQVNAEMRTVCEDMFPQIRCEVGIVLSRGPASHTTILATLGLGATDLRGALVVMASPSFFRATYPLATTSAESTESDILDWAGEVANQALGRINNRFAVLGCVFSLGIPTVVCGDDMRIDIADDRRHASLRGRMGDEEIVMVLHIQRTNGGPLFRPDEFTAIVGEGEDILF
jgi:CheY-specific phosphatase CheX